MKKKLLFLTVVITINAITISFVTKPAQTEGVYDHQYTEYPCFCEGQTFPDPMECNMYVCNDGDIWVCQTSWGNIPCGSPPEEPTPGG